MSVRILIGDVRERLADLPSDSVDCVVTSPPYWGLRDYGAEGQLGLEPTWQEHVSTMADIFDQVRRVLSPKGTLWLNYGDSYVGNCPGGGEQGDRWNGHKGSRGGSSKQPHTGAAVRPLVQPNRMPQPGLKPKDLCGIPWRVAFALQERGWWLRQDIIWSKPNPRPEIIRDRCTKAHEYLFLLAKSERYYFDAEAIREQSVTADIRRPYGSPGANMLDPRGKQGEGKPRKIKMPDGWDTGPGGHGSFHRNGREKGKTRELGSKGEGTPDDVRASAGARMGRGAGWRDDPNTAPLYRNKRSVWEIATAAFSEAHFATFPPALVAPCLLAGCPVGGTVLDPFFGAGTTGLVADRLQRNCIGIELNAEYAEIAMRRIQGDAAMFADVSIEHCGPNSRAAA